MTFSQVAAKSVDFVLKMVNPFHPPRGKDLMPSERKTCTILGIYEGME
jgi:hypothetical protein